MPVIQHPRKRSFSRPTSRSKRVIAMAEQPPADLIERKAAVPLKAALEAAPGRRAEVGRIETFDPPEKGRGLCANEHAEMT